MRNILRFFFILLTFSIFSSTYAGVKELEKNYNIIEQNLIIGVESENQGLRLSAAYFLGEIKSKNGVIPLMRMLKTSSCEEERIIAALSLAKIKSEKGIFAVKQRIEFDDSERVKRLCKIFYYNHIFEKIKTDVIVEPFNFAYLNLDFKDIKLEHFLN